LDRRSDSTDFADFQRGNSPLFPDRCCFLAFATAQII
jgi:hypothetical protein